MIPLYVHVIGVSTVALKVALCDNEHVTITM